MNKIRNYAKTVGHEVVGKLTRHSEWERCASEYCYIDENNNEYIINKDEIAIVTAEGDVI